MQYYDQMKLIFKNAKIKKQPLKTSDNSCAYRFVVCMFAKKKKKNMHCAAKANAQGLKDVGSRPEINC